jgi:hypothetical protein
LVSALIGEWKSGRQVGAAMFQSTKDIVRSEYAWLLRAIVCDNSCAERKLRHEFKMKAVFREKSFTKSLNRKPSGAS